MTRHIFTGTESGKLRKPGKGRAAPAKTASVRPLPPPLSIRPSEVVLMPSGPTKPELPPHPNPSAPGDLRLGPYSHRCPNTPVAFPARRGAAPRSGCRSLGSDCPSLPGPLSPRAPVCFLAQPRSPRAGAAPAGTVVLAAATPSPSC